MTSVVITMPAYKAAQTLARTVEDIPEGIASHLVLVDDASPDETVAIARSLGLHVRVHPENRGYGGNQKTCYREALELDGDIVVLLHPDYQYDPKAVPLLIAPILAGSADMTFGSRFAGLGDPRAGGMPMYRYLGNRLTTVLENLALGSHFTETHSGMRAYTRECLLRMPFLAYSDDFWFDTQFLVDAVTGGMRVIEVPIPTRYTQESSSIAIGSSVRYVAASLIYAARRSLERGRKGRRNPVARRVRASGGAEVALAVPTDHDRAAVAEVAGAFVGGDDVVLLGGATDASPGPEGLAALVLERSADVHAARRVHAFLGVRGLRMVAWQHEGSRIVVLARAGRAPG